jgi:hypothetical protein
MLNWLISIVIKPDPDIDPIKELCPGLHGSNRVNPEKLKKKKNLIFHMKKLRNNPCKYRLDML